MDGWIATVTTATVCCRERYKEKRGKEKERNRSTTLCLQLGAKGQQRPNTNEPEHDACIQQQFGDAPGPVYFSACVLDKECVLCACSIHLSDLHSVLSHISRFQARIPSTLTPASQLVPAMTDQWCLKPCQFTLPVSMVGVPAFDGKCKRSINVLHFYNVLLEKRQMRWKDAK